MDFIKLLTTSAGAASGLGLIHGCGGDDDVVEPITDAGGEGGTGGGAAGSGGTTAGGSAGMPDAGGEGGEDASGGTTSAGGTSPRVDSCETDVELANAHIHEVSVPAEDVEAGAEMTYELSTVAGHTHSSTLSADDMETLAFEGTLEIESSEDSGHTHTVTVTCS